MKVEVEVPNEGPIVDGLVQLADGSGVLPPFVTRIECSQCGWSPEYIAVLGCSCGRTAEQAGESRE